MRKLYEIIFQVKHFMRCDSTASPWPSWSVIAETWVYAIVNHRQVTKTEHSRQILRKL